MKVVPGAGISRNVSTQAMLTKYRCTLLALVKCTSYYNILPHSHDHLALHNSSLCTKNQQECLYVRRTILVHVVDVHHAVTVFSFILCS